MCCSCDVDLWESADEISRDRKSKIKARVAAWFVALSMRARIKLGTCDRKPPRWLVVRVYGRWCGPNVSGPGTPVDKLDSACKDHDNCYAGKADGTSSGSEKLDPESEQRQDLTS